MGGTLSDLIEIACEQTREINEMTLENRQKWSASQAPFPATIPLGDGSFIFTTRKCLAALREFGRRWRQESEDRKRLLESQKAGQLAVAAFGELLSEAAENENPFSIINSSRLKERLEKQFSDAQKTFTHYLPCQIFRNSSHGKFSVGPVDFIPRNDMLDIVESLAEKQLDWVDYVKAHWRGEHKIQRPVSESAITLNNGQWTALNVIDGMGSCMWVAVVEISSRDQTQSRAYAESAVRIAIDTLGLVLQPESARQIRHATEEISSCMKYSFMQMRGHPLSQGLSRDLVSLHGPSGQDQWLLHATDDLRVWAGAAIKTFIEPTPSSAIPELHQRWLDAMYWHGQSRRETVEFIGLVNAGICLDVLAKGGKTKGIVRLCCTLFGLKPETPILDDDTTLYSLIKTIYEDGRSQLGHGGKPGLMKDLPIGRDTAVNFATYVLSRYIEGLHKYTGPDTYEDYLAALPNIFPPAT